MVTGCWAVKRPSFNWLPELGALVLLVGYEPPSADETELQQPVSCSRQIKQAALNLLQPGNNSPTLGGHPHPAPSSSDHRAGSPAPASEVEQAALGGQTGRADWGSTGRADWEGRLEQYWECRLGQHWEGRLGGKTGAVLGGQTGTALGGQH